MMTDIQEYDVWLTPFDMDHLNAGMPVYKPIEEDALLVLRAGDWDTIERVRESDSDDE